MDSKAIFIFSLVALAGCPYTHPIDDGGDRINDLKCQVQPDLAPSLLKCTAAKGLAGDNLLCIDFASIPDQPLGVSPPAKLVGWDFVTNCGGMNWEIANGKLQIKNFGVFAGTCSVNLPTFDLKQPQYQQYNSVVLSVVQRLDTNDPNQTASMYLGLPISARAFWDKTGKRERQQLMISMNRSDPVPMAASQVYQYQLQIISGGMFSGLQGWQIESVAINASP